MINLEIDNIKGVRKAFPKMYLGTAVGGYRVCIAYDNHLLEMRVVKQGDPRRGILVMSRRVHSATQHDIADERMVEEIERGGHSFVNRPRVIAMR